MAANKVKLNIAGAQYSILAEDEPAYVQHLGKELDLKMNEIMKASSRVSTTQAAVLAALDFADIAAKSTITADRLRDQIKDYLDDASSAKSKADWARHETETLKKERDELRTENLRLKAELDRILSTLTSSDK